MRRGIRKSVVMSIVKKEFAQAFRDFRMRGIMFGSPLLMVLVFGYAISTDVKDIRLAVCDEDRSAMSRGVIEKMTASGYFRLQKYIETENEIEPVLARGEAEACLRLGRGLSKMVKSGKQGELQLIVDGTDSNRAAVISAYAGEILQGFFSVYYRDRIRMALMTRSIQERGASGGGAPPPGAGVRLIERTFYNPSLLSRNFFLPGIIGFIVSLITVMLTSMSIVKERESGTMEQIIVSPIRPVEFILGKTIPFAVIGCIDMVLVTIVAIAWFDVPFRGSAVFLLAAGLIYILSTLAVGIYISTISRTQQQAMMSFFLFFIPAILFSGFVFPVYVMPETIQAITWLNPLLYFIVIIRGVFLKGVGVLVLWKELLALCVIGGLLFILSARRLGRRIE